MKKVSRSFLACMTLAAGCGGSGSDAPVAVSASPAAPAAAPAPTTAPVADPVAAPVVAPAPSPTPAPATVYAAPTVPAGHSLVRCDEGDGKPYDALLAGREIKTATGNRIAAWTSSAPPFDTRVLTDWEHAPDPVTRNTFRGGIVGASWTEFLGADGGTLAVFYAFAESSRNLYCAANGLPAIVSAPQRVYDCYYATSPSTSRGAPVPSLYEPSTRALLRTDTGRQALVVPGSGEPGDRFEASAAYPAAPGGVLQAICSTR